VSLTSISITNARRSRLLKQVLLHSDVLPPDLETAYEEWSDRRRMPDATMFSRQLSDACSKFSSAFIILDALDECSGGTLEEIITLANDLSESQAKIFCTSRTHLVNLGERLQTELIHIEANSEDVISYLRNRLAKQKRFSGYTEMIIERLSSEARGK